MKNSHSSEPIPKSRKLPSKKSQIRDYISGLLHTGEYGTGQMLPTLRQIADEFNTSVTPVIQAMREFEAEGMIEMVQGQGCQVRNVQLSDGKIVARPVIDVIGLSETLDPRTRKHTVIGLQFGILHALSTTRDIKTTVIAVAVNDQEALDGALREVINQRPNGLAIGPLQEFTEAQIVRLRQIRTAGTHVVLFAGHYEATDFDAVESDFCGGQKMLTNYLLQRGHKEILRFSFGEKSYFERQKQAGFDAALDEAGFPEGTGRQWTTIIHDPRFGPDLIERRLAQTVGSLAIELSKRPVTAIMAANDYRVAEVRKALNILGRRDIEVTGYDGFWNELLGELTTHYGEESINPGPPATVDTHLVECGSHMARRLVDRVHGLPYEGFHRVIVPQTLILP